MFLDYKLHYDNNNANISLSLRYSGFKTKTNWNLINLCLLPFVKLAYFMIMNCILLTRIVMFDIIGTNLRIWVFLVELVQQAFEPCCLCTP